MTVDKSNKHDGFYRPHRVRSAQLQIMQTGRGQGETLQFPCLPRCELNACSWRRRRQIRGRQPTMKLNIRVPLQQLRLPNLLSSVLSQFKTPFPSYICKMASGGTGKSSPDKAMPSDGEGLPLPDRRSASRSSGSASDSGPESPPRIITFDLSQIMPWSEYFKLRRLETYKLAEGEEPFKVDKEINDRVSIWSGDITKLEIDAIVNAANSMLLAGGGVCGFIHRAAGPELQDECDSLDGCDDGQSKITKGYNLPAKHVIHTVGPQGEKPAVLQSAYQSALEVMVENKLKTIAFPCISTGIFGYPQQKAAVVALKTVRDFLEQNKGKVDRVIFVTFMKEDVIIYEKLMSKYYPTEEGGSTQATEN